MKLHFTFPIILGLALLSNAPAADSRLGVQSKGQYEYMFISGDGKKAWYSGLELEQIARAYAKTQKLDFNFDGAESNIWVHTDGHKVLAEVWFSTGAGRPTLQIQIGRKGNALKHKVVEAKGAP